MVTCKSQNGKVQDADRKRQITLPDPSLFRKPTQSLHLSMYGSRKGGNRTIHTPPPFSLERCMIARVLLILALALALALAFVLVIFPVKILEMLEYPTSVYNQLSSNAFVAQTVE